MTPVRIRGTIYRSITAAAIGEGVNPSTVRKHLNAGTPHLIGLQTRTEAKPFDDHGVAYPSQAAAALALGVSFQRVSQRAKRQRAAHEPKPQ